MRISRNAVFGLALVAGFTVLGLDAHADVGTAGRQVVDAIEGAVTGNIGLFIGLALAILGIWTWVVKQETAAGIMLIVGGVLITVAPGVFNTIGSIVAPIVDSAGGNALQGDTGRELIDN